MDNGMPNVFKLLLLISHIGRLILLTETQRSKHSISQMECVQCHECTTCGAAILSHLTTRLRPCPDSTPRGYHGQKYKQVFEGGAVGVAFSVTLGAMSLRPLLIFGSFLHLACIMPSLLNQRRHVHYPSKSEASSLAQVLHISSPRMLPIICTLYRRIINLYIAYDNAWCVTG